MSRALGNLNICYDPVKHERNVLQRDIPFSMGSAFEFESALIVIDDRQDYGEIREAAIGFIGDRVHVLIFTIRAETLWVISLRKANKREIRRYVDYLSKKTTEPFSKTPLERARLALAAMTDEQDKAITADALTDADNPPADALLAKRGRPVSDNPKRARHHSTGQ